MLDLDTSSKNGLVSYFFFFSNLMTLSDFLILVEVNLRFVFDC